MGNNVSVCNKDRYGNDDAFKSLLGRFSSGLGCEDKTRELRGWIIINFSMIWNHEYLHDRPGWIDSDGQLG